MAQGRYERAGVAFGRDLGRQWSRERGFWKELRRKRLGDIFGEWQYSYSQYSDTIYDSGATSAQIDAWERGVWRGLNAELSAIVKKARARRMHKRLQD